MKTGISQNVEQRIISGARVAFDPRTTEQAHGSRDPKNGRGKPGQRKESDNG